jgi:hypothetical protein
MTLKSAACKKAQKNSYMNRFFGTTQATVKGMDSSGSRMGPNGIMVINLQVLSKQQVSSTAPSTTTWSIATVSL